MSAELERRGRCAALAQAHPKAQSSWVALIADSSNQEIDHLNARAQHLPSEHGELGARELELSSVHYGLRQGNLVAFTAQHRLRGQPRGRRVRRRPTVRPPAPVPEPSGTSHARS